MSVHVCSFLSPFIWLDAATKMTPPTYSKPMPLPTYTQSEKYEQDGVLEMDLREEPDNLPTQQRVVVTNNSDDVDVGTACEFIFFFIGMYVYAKSAHRGL